MRRILFKKMYILFEFALVAALVPRQLISTCLQYLKTNLLV